MKAIEMELQALYSLPCTGMSNREFLTNNISLIYCSGQNWFFWFIISPAACKPTSASHWVWQKNSSWETSGGENKDDTLHGQGTKYGLKVIEKGFSLGKTVHLCVSFRKLVSIHFLGLWYFIQFFKFWICIFFLPSLSFRTPWISKSAIFQENTVL